MKRKESKTLMVNNSTNINKTNENLLSQIIGCKKNKKKHWYWRWKSKFWLATGTKMWQVKTAYLGPQRFQWTQYIVYTLNVIIIWQWPNFVCHYVCTRYSIKTAVHVSIKVIICPDFPSTVHFRISPWETILSF